MDPRDSYARTVIAALIERGAADVPSMPRSGICRIQPACGLANPPDYVYGLLTTDLPHQPR